MNHAKNKPVINETCSKKQPLNNGKFSTVINALYYRLTGGIFHEFQNHTIKRGP